MNKAELIAAVAQSADLTKKDAEAAVSAITETITKALCEGDKVQLVGFGTFEVRAREQVRTPEQAKQSKLQLQRFLHSKPAKL